MENPCLEEGRQSGGDTRPIKRPWQREKSVKMMNSLTDERTLTRPPPGHICAGTTSGDSAYFAAFFAVEPWIA
jgi:hypothetical protein